MVFFHNNDFFFGQRPLFPMATREISQGASSRPSLNVPTLLRDIQNERWIMPDSPIKKESSRLQNLIDMIF
jgi:hypothetical protein